MIGFGIKFLQAQFYISASYAAMLGVLVCIGALGGVIIPLIIMNAFKLQSSSCFLISGISNICLFIVYIPSLFLLTCPNQPIAGLFDSAGNPINPPEIETACNQGCHCTTDYFYPICDRTSNVTYVTPCLAGCLSSEDDIIIDEDDVTLFFDCECSQSENTIFAADRCPVDCNTLWPFIVCFVFVFMFLYSPLPLTPSAIMRSVEPRLKSFQMSLQLMIVRIFGSIPGPVLIGLLIDKSCVLWQTDQNDNRGSCFVYDNYKMVQAFFYIRKLTP